MQLLTQFISCRHNSTPVRHTSASQATHSKHVCQHTIQHLTNRAAPSLAALDPTGGAAAAAATHNTVLPTHNKLPLDPAAAHLLDPNRPPNRRPPLPFCVFFCQPSDPFRSATTTATLSVVYRLSAMSTIASATCCAFLPPRNCCLQCTHKQRKHASRTATSQDGSPELASICRYQITPASARSRDSRESVAMALRLLASCVDSTILWHCNVCAVVQSEYSATQSVPSRAPHALLPNACCTAFSSASIP